MNKSEKRLKSFVLPIMAPVEHLFLHTVLKRETTSAVGVNYCITFAPNMKDVTFLPLIKFIISLGLSWQARLRFVLHLFLICSDCTTRGDKRELLRHKIKINKFLLVPCFPRIQLTIHWQSKI